MFRLLLLLVLGATLASAEPPARRPTLFIIGDSTVRNGNGRVGWGTPLVAHFDSARLRVQNRALGGTSSRSYGRRGLWADVLAELQPGDFVLMQFGHNDGGALDDAKGRASLKGNSDEQRVVAVQGADTPETVLTYGAYLRQYIADAQGKGATPIVCSLIPRNLWTDGKVGRAAGDYGRWAAEAAKAGGAAFLNLNEIVAGHYDELGQEKVAAEFFTAADHTHTTPAGAEFNAACVVEGLRALPDQRLAGFLRAHPAPLDSSRPAAIGGLTVAGHAWTWGKGTVFEAINHCREAGVEALEVFLMGQKLSDETGEVLLGETMPEDAIARLQAKCAGSGVRLINAYIGQQQWTRIGQDEAALRRFFEMGKRLGVSGFTGEPAEAQWDMVERMVKAYGVTFSIHNHARGFEAEYFGGPYPYWDPRETAAKLEAQKRDARFGICLDTGHAARSGLDVVAVLKAIAGRCISVHLKDVSAATLEAHDVPYGQGIVDIPALLAELRRQKIAGHVGLEYEWTASPTFNTDVRGLVDFIRKNPEP